MLLLSGSNLNLTGTPIESTSDGYISLNCQKKLMLPAAERRSRSPYLHSTVRTVLEQIGIDVQQEIKRRPTKEGVDRDLCHICQNR